MKESVIFYEEIKKGKKSVLKETSLKKPKDLDNAIIRLI